MLHAQLIFSFLVAISLLFIIGMEGLITPKTQSLVNVQFYQQCRKIGITSIEDDNNLDRIKPIFVTILSEILQPLKGENEEFDSMIKNVIDDICFTSDKKDLVDDVNAKRIDGIEPLLSMIDTCFQLFKNNVLLDSFTENELRGISRYLSTFKLYYDDINERKNDLSNDNYAHYEISEAETNRKELKDKYDYDIIEEEIEIIGCMVDEGDKMDVDDEKEEEEAQGEKIQIVENLSNPNIKEKVNNLIALDQKNLEKLFQCASDKKMKYDFGLLLTSGKFRFKDFEDISKAIGQKFDVEQIFEWSKNEWDKLGTGIDYDACSCGFTSYVLDRKNQTDCTNPDCKVEERKRVKMRYESIRSLLAHLFINKKTRKIMYETRAKYADDSDSVISGNGFARFKEKEKQPNTFCFNLGMTIDGISEHEEVKLNVVAMNVLDLPPKLRDSDEYQFIPTYFENKLDKPGKVKEILKVLMADLSDLWNEGFKVTVDGVEYTIFANLVIFTGDNMMLSNVLELPSVREPFPCVCCKIKRVNTKAIGNPISFKDGKEYSLNTSKELCELAESGKFINNGVDWGLKADFAFRRIDNFDFMNVITPNLKYIALSDIFIQRIIRGPWYDPKFEEFDEESFVSLNDNITSIIEYLIEEQSFKDYDDILRLFESKSYFYPIKMDDIKTLLHLFPLLVKDNLGKKDSMQSKILELLVELSQHLAVFMSSGVPRDDIPLLKKNYIKLMSVIDELSEKYEFLRKLTSVSNHYIIHMFDKWDDIGSFKDTLDFKLEKICKDVKELTDSSDLMMNILNLRVPVKLYSNLREINKSFEDNKKGAKNNALLSNYKFSMGEKVRKANMHKYDKLINAAASIFNVKKNRELVKVYEHDNIMINSNELVIDSCKQFARYRKPGELEWKYINVEKILMFKCNKSTLRKSKSGNENLIDSDDEYDDEYDMANIDGRYEGIDGFTGDNLLIIKYNKMKVKENWVPCVSEEMEKCINFELSDISQGSGYMLLDDRLDIIPVCGLMEHGKMILDCQPDYNNLFRRRKL